MKIHPLITDSGTLAALVERLATHDFVAVDTEFMRESTYWPELCLIQIASVDEAAAIDPMADGIDLKPLWDLLVDNEDVLKVFHAGGQDLEIVHNVTGKTPQPLFDTQIAAMALGLGEQIGYTNLVAAYANIQVDKGARFTDWARRPLNDRQIEIGALGIDGGGFVRAGDLHQAQIGVIGALAHELGINRDEISGSPAGAKLFESRGVRHQRMNQHGARYSNLAA